MRGDGWPEMLADTTPPWTPGPCVRCHKRERSEQLDYCIPCAEGITDAIRWAWDFPRWLYLAAVPLSTPFCIWRRRGGGRITRWLSFSKARRVLLWLTDAPLIGDVICDLLYPSDCMVGFRGDDA